MARRTELDVGPGALADYYDWFKEARPGESLVYWRGDLRFDRDLDNFPTAEEAQALQIKALDAMARRIGSDAKDGYLLLTQKRFGVNAYEYRATRIQSPREAAIQPMAGKPNGVLVDA